jgi:allantoin racemase
VRILYIGPQDRVPTLREWAWPGVEVEGRETRARPASIESEYAVSHLVPWLVEAVVEAERDGFDAVMTGCFADPGLHECRESVTIPVVGPGEASLAVAKMLGHSLSVIIPSKNMVSRLRNQALMLGMDLRVLSPVVLGVSVQTIRDGGEEVYGRVLRVAQQAVESDNADVVVLGCTALSNLADRLGKEIDLPVVNPLRVALSMAQLMASCGLSHSKSAYPFPPGFEILTFTDGLQRPWDCEA